jgi:hypothetical protein
MPIRINLLAEAQAAEELRRHDPVKRTIWIGMLLVIAALVWSSSLWLKGMRAKGELSGFEAGLHSRTNDYAQLLEKQRKLKETRVKMAALQQLATNRFLNGTMLNALQKATTENVQLTHIAADQAYTVIEGTKITTNGNRVVAGKPPAITEKITLTLEAKDAGPNPGDSVTKFKEAIAASPYFQEYVAKTNGVRLKDLGPPTADPSGKQFLLFTLECRYPEIKR